MRKALCRGNHYFVGNLMEPHEYHWTAFFCLQSVYTLNLPPPLTHRIRPTKETCAWDKAGQTIKLQPAYSKSVTGTEYNFDEILTGSENKPVYNAVARSHVCAAMDGYNAVIFAYGQTASGKTFTLVSLVPKYIIGLIDI